MSDLRLNVLLDGLFHTVTYIFTVVGIVLLWRTPNVLVSGRTLFGSAVLGWELFNVVEGIIDHHLLGVHHVCPDGPGPVLLWDLTFLAWGLLFVTGGYTIVRDDDALVKSPRRNQPQAESEPALDP